jgi:hypothetical protein
MISFTDDSTVSRNRDLEIMRRPHLWPLREILFLKNLTLKGNGKGGGEERSPWPVSAFLTWDKSSGEFSFRLETEATASRHGKESLLRELIKEGWLVD